MNLAFLQRRRRIPRALVALAAVCVVLLVDSVGLLGMTDGNLRRIHYDLRGLRASQYTVLLVAADQGTLDEWGLPPWSWQQLDTLVSAIVEGGPRFVAVLEPGPRLLPPGPPPVGSTIERALEEGRLVLPPAASVPGQPGLDMGESGLVERVALASHRDPATPTVTARVLERAGLGFDPGASLPVDFLGPPASFPTVSAHRVAAGEIPAGTFRDRIVLVGVTAQPYMPRVPTPVGPMTPVEVQANAVLAVADGAVMRSLPAPAHWIALIALALMLAWTLPQLAVHTAHSLTVVIIGGLLVIDYLAFVYGALELGVTGPALAVLVVAATTGTLERRKAATELEQLDRRLTHRLRVESAQAHARADGPGVWRDFVRASRLYFDCESSVLASLPDDNWYLDLKEFAGIAPDDIYEKRRDVRRAPYQRAYLSHRPEWSDRMFVAPRFEQKTLFVPLVAFGRILGFWIVNFQAEVVVGTDDLRLIQTLANQLSLAIERERLGARANDGNGADAPEGRIVARIADMQRGFARLVQEQAGLVALFERLPVGVLVATLWGEPRLVNGRLKRLLSERGLDSVHQTSMPEILERLTGLDENSVHAVMRRLVRNPDEIVLPGFGHGAGKDAFDVSVSRVNHLELADAIGEETSVPLAHFVVTVSHREVGGGPRHAGLGEPPPAVQVLPALATPPPSPEPPTAEHRLVVDVTEVVQSVVESVERDPDGSGPPLLLSFPENRPRARADRVVLEEALGRLLRDARSSDPAGPAHPIGVDETADAVIVQLVDPSTVFKGRSLRWLAAPDSLAAEESPPLDHLRRVKDLLESILGTLEVESRPGLGTVYRISLVKAPVPDRASA